MIFKDDNEAIEIIKANKITPAWVTKAREQAKELSALINGELFTEELISKIEHIESDDKAKARKKYSRSIIDFFERLFLPINNIFSATGGIKKYEIKSDVIKKQFLETIAYVRDGKSIERYIQEHWLNAYHSDPNGIIFLEYSTENNENKICPCYKSINIIRNYKSKGQLCEWILFEPELKNNKTYWRIVDDLFDRTFEQVGEIFILIPEKTFEHPFGEVPAIINSDILDIKSNCRLSPIHKIIPLAKEYARDQSIKTLYKFLHGIPTHWRYVSQCRTCTGIGKKGNEKCTDCDGRGFYQKKDITDMVTLPVPDKDGVKLAPDIAGFISPDLETWKQYNDELELLEIQAHKTHWGTFIEKGKNETATGRFIDIQPVINKLNKYADVAEWVEWKMTEMIANFIDLAKIKTETVSLIVYGRRYIIEGVDVIQEKYEKAKKEGDNNIILDRLFEELLTVKYKNDLDWLRDELLKSKIEPYLHLSVQEVNTIFGTKEASRKVYFQKWWKNLSTEDLRKETTILQQKFNTDFEATQEVVQEKGDAKIIEAQASLRGSVGGVQGIVSMLTAVSLKQMTRESVIQVLNKLYGIAEEDANKMV